MDIVEFEGMNCVYAKDQAEYRPLPAYRSPDGVVVSCWQLTAEERQKVLETGQVWVSLMTFNRPLQPIRVDAERPPIIDEGRKEKRDIANEQAGNRSGQE
jgi:hypothetical protein